MESTPAPDDSRTCSVVIPVRDGAATIRRSMASVLAQEHIDVHVVVVDDGSSDETTAIVDAMREPRVRLVRQDPRGVSAARNAGVRHSTGRYVAFLDADDLVRTDWLHTMTSLAAEHHASVVCCGVEIREPGRTSTAFRGPEAQPDGLTTLFLAGTYLVERTVFLEAGGFDEQLKYSENLELGLRLQRMCRETGRKIAATDAPLLIMDRTHSGGSKPWRYDAIERILSIHGDELRSSSDRYAKWLGMAAVEAARHGERAAAVRYAVRSVRARPMSGRGWVRLITALTPALSRRRWGDV